MLCGNCDGTGLINGELCPECNGTPDSEERERLAKPEVKSEPKTEAKAEPKPEPKPKTEAKPGVTFGKRSF